VIKRFIFAGQSPGVSAQAGLTPSGIAPPLGAVACVVIPELSDPGRPCDRITVEWFTDAAHLARYEQWLPTPDGSVVAEQAVLRGEPWLEQRWRDGGGTVKHMALATRAAGLTPAGFAQRWRAHAGTAGSTVIPDVARGRAYVQNYPVPRPPGAGEWRYDAVNEVYFDDEAGLRQRVEWFRSNVPDPADGGLFGQSWLIAVREIVIL
jgi:hypothetical protein